MIDSSLASQVREFQQLMEKEKDLYSVKDLLSIYHRYLPVNMTDETLRKNVHCYLMVSELETELNQTWFYAVFPGLRYTANGVTLSSICGILRAKLHSLEDLSQYPFISRELVFGSSYFINPTKMNPMEVITVLPNSVLCGLWWERVMCSGSLSAELDPVSGYRWVCESVYESGHGDAAGD